MKELYNKVASKWKSIEIFLNIPEEELSTISQREHAGDPQECLMAMHAECMAASNQTTS